MSTGAINPVYVGCGPCPKGYVCDWQDADCSPAPVPAVELGAMVALAIVIAITAVLSMRRKS